MNSSLTIIIPHFNSYRSVEKLLSTIPQRSNIEVIVVDDRSEKEHIEKLKELLTSQSFILLENNTGKKGAGVARNLGLKKATGKWVLFSDADDYFSDKWYESVSNYFSYDCDVVFFKPTSIYTDTNEVADRHIKFVNLLENYQDSQTKQNELSLRYHFSVPWSKLIKRELIIENNIDFDEVMVANDVMFSTKVGYFMKKFETSDNVIYVVTRSHGSLTTDMSEKAFDTRFEVFVCFHNFLKEYLPSQDYSLINFSEQSKFYITKSMNFGKIKVFKVLSKLMQNNIRFFHARLLNPVRLLSKIKHYKSIEQKGKSLY